MILLLVLLAIALFVAVFTAKQNAEKAATRRAALALAAECQAREDERLAARDTALAYARVCRQGERRAAEHPNPANGDGGTFSGTGTLDTSGFAVKRLPASLAAEGALTRASEVVPDAGPLTTCALSKRSHHKKLKAKKRK